jgi:hypothetical protein
MVVLNIFGIIIAAFRLSKNVYLLTFTKQVHRSHQNCGPSVWNLCHVNLVPRIGGGGIDFLKICVATPTHTHTHIKLRRFEDRILTRMCKPERKDRIIE